MVIYAAGNLNCSTKTSQFTEFTLPLKRILGVEKVIYASREGLRDRVKLFFYQLAL